MLSKDKVCIVHLTYLYFPNRFLLWTRFFFALKTWRWRHILLHLRRGLFNCRNRLSDWRTQGEPNKINRLADLQLQCYSVKSVFKHAFNEILYYWNINYKISKLFSYWEQTLPFLFELFQGSICQMYDVHVAMVIAQAHWVAWCFLIKTGNVNIRNKL